MRLVLEQVNERRAHRPSRRRHRDERRVARVRSEPQLAKRDGWVREEHLRVDVRQVVTVGATLAARQLRHQAGVTLDAKLGHMHGSAQRARERFGHDRAKTGRRSYA